MSALGGLGVTEILEALGRTLAGLLPAAAAGATDVLVDAGLRSLYALAVFALVAPLCWLSEGRERRGEGPMHAWGGPLRAALWSLVLLRLLLPADLAAPWSLRALWTALTGGDSPAAAIAGLPSPAVGGLDGATAVAADPVAELLTAALPLALLALWLAGSLAVACLLARQRRCYRRRVRHARPVTAPAVLARRDDLARRLGVRRRVPLRASGGGGTPFTVGTLRPVIYLPASLLETRDGQAQPGAALDAALAHELAHVARRDDLRLCWVRLLQAVWFFHPLVWWVGARLAWEREHLTDARVLASGALTPRSYGRGLLSAVRRRGPGGLAVAALHHPKRRLSMRIRSIAQYRAPSRRQRFHRVFTLFAVGLLAVLVLPLAPSAEGEAGTTAVAVASVDGPGAEGVGSSTAPGTARASGTAWASPVSQARLTSAYGPRKHPRSGERVLHRGVDLAAPAGTPVRSPAAGVVAVATERWEGGERHGTVVIVDHGDGLRSFYSHLESFTVAPGQAVAAGQQVGTVGNTGDSTGPHLHFEVWQDGEPVNPTEWVSALR